MVSTSKVVPDKIAQSLFISLNFSNLLDSSRFCLILKRILPMVTKKLPENLKLLSNIVNNLWWSWNQDIWPIFERLNPTLWQEEKNPILLLNEASDETLNLLSNDKEYVANLQSAANRLDSYLNKNDLWFEEKYSNHVDNTIAYFSAEYGIHESLKIYSGGLGVLAGDTLKSMADIGIDAVGITLLSEHGYFTQHLDDHGYQTETPTDWQKLLLLFQCLAVNPDDRNTKTSVNPNCLAVYPDAIKSCLVVYPDEIY